MADSKQITVKPVAQMANPRRVLPDCIGRPVPFAEIGGGEADCLLWGGQIIDATFPPV